MRLALLALALTGCAAPAAGTATSPCTVTMERVTVDNGAVLTVSITVTPTSTAEQKADAKADIKADATVPIK